MLRILCGAFVLGASFVAPAFATGPTDEPKPGVEAKVAFEALKTLAGEWKVDCEGQHNEKAATIRYQVTAAGSVVMETQFPGTDHEMISMYHLDGPNLLMTHYCAAHNQPRLKLDRAKSRADDLIFVFDGGTNLDPAKDMHIHGARIHIQGKDKVLSDWEGYQDGKSAGTEKFTLTK